MKIKEEDKRNIYPVLVNEERYERTPGTPLLNLKFIYTFKGKIIDNESMESFSDMEELHKLAMDNFKRNYKFKSMSLSLMLVITTDMSSYGAVWLGCDEVLKEIAEKTGDFVILPSSIHELICIPYSLDCSPKEYEDMIKSVNESDAVSNNEYLSDCAYLYKDGKLSIYK